MAVQGFDPEIIQDFLTESGELLESLDQDLVLLESTPEDPELLNKVFRALHTIKGSASFLALTNLVELAHAAESALNAARNRVFVVGREAMDLLLAAVDTLRRQFDDLREGRDLIKADASLVAGLTVLGEGKGKTAGSTTSAPTQAKPAAASSAPASTLTPATTSISASTAAASTAPVGQTTGTPNERPLSLSSGKNDLLDFFISDVDESVTKLDALLGALAQTRDAEPAVELLSSLSRTAAFFEFDTMNRVVELVSGTVAPACELEDQHFAQALDALRSCVGVLREQTGGLRDRKLIDRDICPLKTRLEALLAGETDSAMPSSAAGSTPSIATGSSSAALAQGVGGSPSSTPSGSTNPSPAAGANSSVGVNAAASQASASATGNSGDTHGPGNAGGDQTIRVEVARLESLLNLVGELVLQKNRLGAIARHAGSGQIVGDQLAEQLSLATGNLDRVTGDIQVAVMRTRLQPLEKLFGRYPRLIRDLSRKTGKNIHLEIVGGETEVDKSVMEELADPLVHLLRNSADHGIEPPAERVQAGKSEQGVIRLCASHEGSHVLIQIIDDGRGLSRAKIGKRAVERGLVTQAQIDTMSDRDVWNFIFAPGFSTAEQVTDLSGRGVGMDVVRTNIAKIKGSVELSSVEGKGTTISIQIPLTVAILTAMMVEIGSEIYAVPLSAIVEIVKPEKNVLSSIRQNPVMRLRDSVLPLLDGPTIFNLPEDKRRPSPFAVVVEQNQQRVGLMVSRLIGQQEVVIKPLNGMVEQAGPVSGATVRDDGGVSLIVDVGAMLRLAEQSRGQHRAGPGTTPNLTSSPAEVSIVGTSKARTSTPA